MANNDLSFVPVLSRTLETTPLINGQLIVCPDEKTISVDYQDTRYTISKPSLFNTLSYINYDNGENATFDGSENITLTVPKALKNIEYKKVTVNNEPFQGANVNETYLEFTFGVGSEIEKKYISLRDILNETLERTRADALLNNKIIDTNTRVDNVHNEILQEASDREAGDNVLGTRIDGVSDDVTAIRDRLTILDEAVTNEALIRQGHDEVHSAAISRIDNSLSEEIATRTNEIQNLSTALNDEATTRGNADTSLRNDLNSEISTRENDDNALSNRITTNADNISTLSNNLNAEINTRSGETSALNNTLNQEIITRGNEDSLIRDDISNINNCISDISSDIEDVVNDVSNIYLYLDDITSNIEGFSERVINLVYDLSYDLSQTESILQENIETEATYRVSGDEALEELINLEASYRESNVSYLESRIDTKQNTLVSGVNIKTIDGNSVVGSGNLQIDYNDVLNQPVVNYSEAATLAGFQNGQEIHSGDKIHFDTTKGNELANYLSGLTYPPGENSAVMLMSAEQSTNGQDLNIAAMSYDGYYMLVITKPRGFTLVWDSQNSWQNLDNGDFEVETDGDYHYTVSAINDPNNIWNGEIIGMYSTTLPSENTFYKKDSDLYKYSSGDFRKVLLETDIDSSVTENSNNPVSSDAVYDALQPIIEVAEGRTKTFIINDVSAITGTLSNDEYTNVSAITGIDLEDLKLGDIILVKQLEKPDYWVSAITNDPLRVSLNKMETSKVIIIDDYDDLNNIPIINVDQNTVKESGKYYIESNTGDLTRRISNQNYQIIDRSMIDSQATNNSNNLLTSGTIYTALNNIENSQIYTPDVSSDYILVADGSNRTEWKDITGLSAFETTLTDSDVKFPSSGAVLDGLATKQDNLTFGNGITLDQNTNTISIVPGNGIVIDQSTNTISSVSTIVRGVSYEELTEITRIPVYGVAYDTSEN